MNTMQDIGALVGRMPDPDKRGKLDGPAWGDAAKIFDAILEQGAAGIARLAGMLQDTDDGRDYRVRWVMNGIAQYVLRKGNERNRTAYIAALIQQLDGNLSKPATGFVIRTLHVVGDGSATRPLGALLHDPVNHEYAAQAILAIRDGAVEEFRRALPGAKGGPRLTILQALGVLRDSGSTGILREETTNENGEVRMAAHWGLANIGNAESIDLVLKGADRAKGWERIKMTSHCMLMADRLAESGNKRGAQKIYLHLRRTRSGDEDYVRDAAEAALEDAK